MSGSRFVSEKSSTSEATNEEERPNEPAMDMEWEETHEQFAIEGESTSADPPQSPENAEALPPEGPKRMLTLKEVEEDLLRTSKHGSTTEDEPQEMWIDEVEQAGQPASGSGAAAVAPEQMLTLEQVEKNLLDASRRTATAASMPQPRASQELVPQQFMGRYPRPLSVFRPGYPGIPHVPPPFRSYRFPVAPAPQQFARPRGYIPRNVGPLSFPQSSSFVAGMYPSTSRGPPQYDRPIRQAVVVPGSAQECPSRYQAMSRPGPEFPVRFPNAMPPEAEHPAQFRGLPRPVLEHHARFQRAPTAYPRYPARYQGAPRFLRQPQGRSFSPSGQRKRGA